MQDGEKVMKYSQTFSESKKKKLMYIIAAMLLVLAAYLGFMQGSVKISLSSVYNSIVNGALTPHEIIFLYSRLPRTLSTLFVGASLSVSGAVLQSLLSNKLASPSIIGVNSGAGFAVTIAACFGIYGGFKLSLIAFCGAFCAVLILCFVSLKAGGKKSTVILTGVALNALFGAFTDSVISFNPTISLMTVDFKIGDFSFVTFEKLIPGMIIISVSLIMLFFFSNRLDIISMGDENAKALGLNVNLFRIIFLILTALLAGCAVSLAGLISFVGLIVPHAVRYSGVTDAKNLLPLSALFGAGFVTLCDAISKSLFSPYEIPVGIIMAFLGVPFFIYILSEKRSESID